MDTTTAIEIAGLRKAFGRTHALDGLDLRVDAGSVHGFLGPNGAGKSTCINLLSGDLAPTSGRVLLGGRDITRLASHQRSRIGIGRSFQRTNVFPGFTAFENCRLAAQAKSQYPFDWWTRAAHCHESSHRAERAIEQAGLAGQTQRLAGTLSHGQKRQLEIAMCLATGPHVLLLDEPLAGMGPEETERMLLLLSTLKPAHAILLVEHDMDAVFRIADHITVMVNGGVIASGDPDAIRVNADVQAAYLGESEAVATA